MMEFGKRSRTLDVDSDLARTRRRILSYKDEDHSEKIKENGQTDADVAPNATSNESSDDDDLQLPTTHLMTIPSNHKVSKMISFFNPYLGMLGIIS